MANQQRRAIRVSATLSMQSDHRAALSFLAHEDGHEQPSKSVQALIEREIERRLGPDWRPAMRTWQQDQEETAR